MTIDICPACGYPTIGADPCAFCRPVLALADNQRFEFSISFDRGDYAVESA